MKKSNKQNRPKQKTSGKEGLKQAITVAAAVASLGASLGVNVGDILAADVKSTDVVSEKIGADQIKGDSSNQLKYESNQYKENQGSNQLKYESNQHKGESRQLKYESNQLKIDGARESFTVKLNGQLLKNGDRVIIGDSGKVFIRSRSGKQTPAQNKTYELQDGTKFAVKGGKIIQ